MLVRESECERIRGLENSQSICQERRRDASPTSFLCNDTISPFPLCSTGEMQMQSASWIDPTLLQVMKARTAVLHRVVRKLRAWPAPNDTQAKKVRFFTLQPVIALDGIRIGEQWVGGEEGGVQRDHGGCEHRHTDCSTSPGSSRETFRRYLRNLRMPHINSCATLIFRAAMYIRYIVYNKHVLIL